MTSGQEVERGVQVKGRARVAAELNLARGEGMPRLGGPQLEGDDVAGSSTGEPEPAAAFVGSNVQSGKELERAGERRRGRYISLCEAQRERVEQDIHGTLLVGPG